MLHDLARVEINRLEAHGITGLSYDEIASLQMAAIAVDEAAKSEGLPVGLPRPVRLTRDIVLFPMTMAAQAVFDRVGPWIGADATRSVQAVAFLLANGRDLDLLRDCSTDRATFLRTVRAWARRLAITPEELGNAVDAVLDAQDETAFIVDARAFSAVIDHARAAGDDTTAQRVRDLLTALKSAERQKRRATVATPSWGAMTLRLAALTGCEPDTWAVKPTAEAIAAYVARLDFEALTAGALGNGAETATERAQKDALRHLYATTDAIARAHLAQRKEHV